MSIITGTEIKTTLRELWPGCLGEIGDSEYFLPSMPQLEFRLKQTTIDLWPRRHAFDCDKYVKVLVGWFAQLIQMEGLSHAWPITEVRGWFAHVEDRHAMVFCPCVEGPRLVEPQNDNIRVPGPGDRVDSFWL